MNFGGVGGSQERTCASGARATDIVFSAVGIWRVVGRGGAGGGSSSRGRGQPTFDEAGGADVVAVADRGAAGDGELACTGRDGVDGDGVAERPDRESRRLPCHLERSHPRHQALKAKIEHDG